MNADEPPRSRARSEYRIEVPVSVDAANPGLQVRLVTPWDVDNEDLAALLLASYGGTVDDEGEDLDDARTAIAHYLGTAVRGPSVVALHGHRIVAIAFVVIVRGLHYVDPVAVAPEWKRNGIGRYVALAAIQRLPADSTAIGAVITDGNGPSERLFRGLGFRRIGAWSTHVAPL